MSSHVPIKAAERIARRIVQDIADGGHAAGDVLPSEAEMMRAYQVSRGSLREALRLLETQGLVFMKSGPSGGPVVGRPDPFYFGRMATLFFRLDGATYDDVAHALAYVDGLIVRLAAERRDPRCAVELLSALSVESCELAAKSATSDAVDKMKDVHRTLARLCGNPILALMSDALGSIFREHIVAVSDAAGILPHSHHDHVRIAELVIKGDADEAEKLAAEHIHRLVDFHRTQVPGIFSQPVRWT
jgi:DNA-binding FadR family transcriptional regulator